MILLSLQHLVEGQQAEEGTVSGDITLETLSLSRLHSSADIDIDIDIGSPTCSHRDHAAVPQASSG